MSGKRGGDGSTRGDLRCRPGLRRRRARRSASSAGTAAGDSGGERRRAAAAAVGLRRRAGPRRRDRRAMETLPRACRVLRDQRGGGWRVERRPRRPPPPPGMPPPAPPGDPGRGPRRRRPRGASRDAASQGKMSHYGMHRRRPRVSADFQHLGMIADLLDDAPGVVSEPTPRRSPDHSATRDVRGDARGTVARTTTTRILS